MIDVCEVDRDHAYATHLPSGEKSKPEDERVLAAVHHASVFVFRSTRTISFSHVRQHDLIRIRRRLASRRRERRPPVDPLRRLAAIRVVNRRASRVLRRRSPRRCRLPSCSHAASRYRPGMGSPSCCTGPSQLPSVAILPRVVRRQTWPLGCGAYDSRYSAPRR